MALPEAQCNQLMFPDDPLLSLSLSLILGKLDVVQHYVTIPEQV